MPGGEVTVILPTLHSSMKPVPRRYEETKPVQIQGFAHTKIIGLGHELHKRNEEKSEQEKLEAIKFAEQAVWAEAEQLKAIALAKARDQTAIEQEKVIKKLKKLHERALKEEALKVEMGMQKLAVAQVKQERMEGAKRLKRAVVETETKCHELKLKAVAEARSEEKKIAASEAADLARKNEEKFDAAVRKFAIDEENGLRDLRDIKDMEKARAVHEAENRERQISLQRSAELTDRFEATIRLLKNDISEKQREIKRLVKLHSETDDAKQQVENCLMDTRRDFQDFIDSLRPFDKQQAEFLIPSLYLDQLENKGYETKALRSGKIKRKK